MTNTLAPAPLVLDQYDRVVDVTYIDIPEYKLGTFQTKVDSANRRLAAAGVDARFEFTFENFQQSVIKGRVVSDEGVIIVDGYTVSETWIRATFVSAVNLSVGNFTFIASLITEEGGVTVHTAPGHELGGFEPAGDTHCDHCGVNRDRTRLYIVRNDDTGELLQLGHSCIEIFTGFSPKGLFALTFDDELRGLGVDDGVGAPRFRVTHALVNEVIALAFAYTNEGRNYVSAKIDWKVGTGQAVRSHIFNGAPSRINFPRDHRGEAAYQEAYDAFVKASQDAARFLADDELIAGIRASVETLDANTDYGRNLRVILNGESVSGKNIGILASLVSVYAREKELVAERAAAPAAVQGFLADEKVRIKTTIELKLKVVREREGDYGWTTWLVGTTPDGHTASWNASNRFSVEENGQWRPLDVGDTIVLSAATVKAHENYKGVDQTVLTRAKVADTRAA